MSLRSPELGLAASLLFAAPLSAQRGHELGSQAIGTASDPALAVAGVYGALRTSTRTRISASAGAGVSSGGHGGLGRRAGPWWRVQVSTGISLETALLDYATLKTPRNTVPRRFVSCSAAQAAPDSMVST